MISLNIDSIYNAVMLLYLMSYCIVIEYMYIFQVNDPQEIKGLLIQQVTAPVRWLDSIQYCQTTHNVSTFLELGTGKILNGLLKQINPAIQCTYV